MTETASLTGVTRACEAVQLSVATYYRFGKRRSSPDPCAAGPKSSGRPGLTCEEQDQIYDELFSERFRDEAVRQVYAKLLDDGRYLCSWRTMYRLLKKRVATTERRRIRRHPRYSKPELVATGPNKVWTWDITYLKTQIRGRFYYLYVVMDIYSRYVVGWLLAERECQELAKELLAQTIMKYRVRAGQLTIHADRGAPMKSQSVSDLLEKLGVDRSHSRPRVSNDNPYSEAGFKTLKYSLEFPDRFDSMEQAEDFCRAYFKHYNTEHHHTGIALLTPYQVHFGKATEILVKRQATLDAAYAKTPERFGKRKPIVQKLPGQVWINGPALQVSEEPTIHAA